MRLTDEDLELDEELFLVLEEDEEEVRLVLVLVEEVVRLELKLVEVVFPLLDDDDDALLLTPADDDDPEELDELFPTTTFLQLACPLQL